MIHLQQQVSLFVVRVRTTFLPDSSALNLTGIKKSIIIPVCMCGHHEQQEKDQPGKVAANPARGQLNRENEYFTVVPVRAGESGLARLVR